jgi:glycosyltransferase involved in cell wall biosynthesis
MRDLTRTWQPDACHLYWVEMAQYADHLPSVLVAPEVSSTRAADELVGASARVDAALWRRVERRALRDVDATVVFTAEDGADFRELDTTARIEVIPFAVEPTAAPLDPVGEDDVVLFVGNFRHTPNVDAARRLAREIFPLVSAARPAARLRLVGAQPPPSVRALAGERVDVVADVADTTPELARAAVVALPLRLGGGMRVKTLEALGAGKAVVATEVGLRGTGVVDSGGALVAESTGDFARAVVSLLEDRERRRDLGAAARVWAEAHSVWEPYVQRHEDLLRSLT